MVYSDQVNRLDKQLLRLARRGREYGAEDLLSKGANPNVLGKHGFTALMRAAYLGNSELVQLFLKHGADTNVTAKDGASALFWACVRGHDQVAALLVKAGANVNAIRDHGPSVLNAAIHGDTATCSNVLVSSLVKAGASVEYRYLGMDAVQYAERANRRDLIPILKPKKVRRVKRR